MVAQDFLYERCFFSDGYTARDIKYSWKTEDSVGVSVDLTLNQFDLTGLRQSSEFIQLTTGTAAHHLLESPKIKILLNFLLARQLFAIECAIRSETKHKPLCVTSLYPVQYACNPSMDFILVES